MNYSALRFSSDTGVSIDLAKRVLDIVDEKDLDPTEMNTVIWRLRDYVMKTHVPDLMEEMDDEEIGGVVDQIIMERAMWKSCPSEVCYAEDEDELHEAFVSYDAEKLCRMFEESEIFKGPVSSETKSKISEALKRFYKGRGGKKVKGRGGSGVTVDTGSVESFLKTVGGIPKAIIDKAKELPADVKNIPAAVKQLVKNANNPAIPKKSARGRGRYSMPEAAWFFTAFAEAKPEGGYKAGDTVTIQIFRTGTWEHPGYGKVEITKDVIKGVVKNFTNRTRGIDLCVDENHEPDHKALAWYKDVFAENNGTECYAKLELTQKGADLLNDGAYKYFSPEIVFSKIDEESGEEQSNLLIGGAFTNRPFFKGMQPLMASESAANGEHSGTSSATEGHAVFFSHSQTMNKFLKLVADLSEKDSIDANEKAELETVYGEMSKEDKTSEVNKAFAELLAKFDEGEEKPEPKPEAEKVEGDEEEGDDEEVEEEEAEEVKASETLEGVIFNDDGTMKVTDAAKFSASVKAQQKKFAEMQREAALIACEKSLAPLVFSEKRKTRVVLPAHKKEIIAFAASLDEAKRAKFFSILGTLKSVPAGEIGTSKEKAKADITKPETFSADDDQVKFFMETFGQDLPTAQKSAADFYAAKAKR